MPVRPEIKYFLHTTSTEDQVALDIRRLSRLLVIKRDFGSQLNEAGAAFIDKCIIGVCAQLRDAGEVVRARDVIEDPDKYFVINPTDLYYKTFMRV